MHEVLVNRLEGLSLPRKSVVRLTDRPDMTVDVYRGRKTTIQQQQQQQQPNKREHDKLGTRRYELWMCSHEPVPFYYLFPIYGGWSGDAMVLGKLPMPGRPTIWITVGQGPK